MLSLKNVGKETYVKFIQNQPKKLNFKLYLWNKLLAKLSSTYLKIEIGFGSRFESNQENLTVIIIQNNSNLKNKIGRICGTNHQTIFTFKVIALDDQTTTSPTTYITVLQHPHTPKTL